MPSPPDTVERFNSSTPRAMPLTYSTRSGRLVFSFPVTVTSSAMAKSLSSGFDQSISQTVACRSPTSGRIFTP